LEGHSLEWYHQDTYAQQKASQTHIHLLLEHTEPPDTFWKPSLAMADTPVKVPKELLGVSATALEVSQLLPDRQ
jgi:hypothetical protein